MEGGRGKVELWRESKVRRCDAKSKKEKGVKKCKQGNKIVPQTTVLNPPESLKFVFLRKCNLGELFDCCLGGRSCR